jgi:tetratricopeptide (TPR) repeat protein
MKFRCYSIIGLTFWCLQAFAAQQETFDQAKAYLRDSNAIAAYELLIDYEDEWSGVDAYDYLLGVAALDSNQAGEAIFSLQRVVARAPDFAGARMELARAYYEVGDNELARNEFNRLLTEDPPDNARQAIESYLESISQRAKTYRASLEGYVGFSGGYDSNAPAATDDERFLSFKLSANNLEQDSMFAQAEAGLIFNKPLTATTQFVINGNVSHRSNPSTHFVDGSNVNLGMAFNYRNGPHTAAFGLRSVASYLNGNANKQDYAFYGNYTYNVSKQWQVSGFASQDAVRFEDLLAIQDVDRTSYGVGLHQMGSGHRLSVSLMGSGDDTKLASSVFGNDSVGIQITNLWGRKSGPVFIDAVATKTEYDKPFYGFNREDDLVAITLGKTWTRVLNKWDLTFHVNYSQKQSTVTLYEFDRWETGVSLRRVFN